MKAPNMSGRKALPSENARLLIATKFGLEYEGFHNQVNSYTCSYNLHNVLYRPNKITHVLYKDSRNCA